MNKLVKTLTIFFIIVSIIVMITVIIAIFNPTPTEDEDIPRPDLDNFKIEELTEEQITKIPFYSTGYRTREHTCGKGSGIAGNQYKYKKVDVDHYRYSAGKEVGITTFNATRAKNTTLTLNIKSSIGSGIAKILVIKDGVIIETLDCGENKSFTYLVDEESIFYVKGLFENAEDLTVDVVRVFNGETPNIDH